MGTLDDSPIPPYAVTCWESDNDIFVALPMKAGGVPYIMRFAKSEGGLSEALKILSARRQEVLTPTEAAPANYTPPKHQPMVKLSKSQERLHAETTEAQRANARALIEQLGLKPK